MHKQATFLILTIANYNVLLKFLDNSILSCFMINFQFPIYFININVGWPLTVCMSLIENLPKETAIKFLLSKSWACMYIQKKKKRWTCKVLVYPKLPLCSFSCSGNSDTQTREESHFSISYVKTSSFKNVPSITLLLLKSLEKWGMRITGGW